MLAELDEFRRSRWLAASGLLAAAVLVLTSCGGQDDAGAMTEPDVGAAPSEPMDDPSPMPTGEDADDMDDEGADEADGSAELAAGAYRPYREDALAEAGYQTNVIFFHASWCPECRAFEESIEAGPIPDGVQILKADYDTETELKKTYDVRIQTTFVKVDDDGEMLSSWIGYEQDRSIDNLLRELE